MQSNQEAQVSDSLGFQFNDSDLQEDEEEIDDILTMLKDSDSDISTKDFPVPTEFSINHTLQRLKFENPVNTIQDNTNNAIDLLHKNMQDVREFCAASFEITSSMITELEITDHDPKPVTAGKLAKFYKHHKEYLSSRSYLAQVQLMFFEVNRSQGESISQQVMSHIAFNLSVSIRKFLLSEKEKLYRIGEGIVHKRDVSEESYGKVRYVGGYCIASLRFHYRKIRSIHCFKSGLADQQKYNEAVSKMELLDGLSLNELAAQLTTEFPESLIETASRQHASRGLTNIPDAVLNFVYLFVKNVFIY